MKLNRNGIEILPAGRSTVREREERLDALNKHYEGVMIAQIMRIRDPEKRQRALKDFQTQTTTN